MTDAPTPTLAVGQRVIVAPFGDYDGWNYHGEPSAGVVLAYATPEIQRRQVWIAESYRVRLDSDPADSPGRTFDRKQLTEEAS